MPRFIVKTHAHSRKPPARWRTGVVLSVDNCIVHVEADQEKKKVLLKVSGPEKSRRAALGFARNALQEVHNINLRINPQPFVPLPDNPAVEESYDHLLKLEGKFGSNSQIFAERRRSRVHRMRTARRRSRTRGSQRSPRYPVPLPACRSKARKTGSHLDLCLRAFMAVVGAISVFGG